MLWILFSSYTANIAIINEKIPRLRSAIEKVACQYEGDPCQIGFKSSLLIEILQNINCKDVVLIIGESSRPGLFCPLKQEEEDNKDLLMLLMPMLLN